MKFNFWDGIKGFLLSFLISCECSLLSSRLWYNPHYYSIEDILSGAIRVGVLTAFIFSFPLFAGISFKISKRLFFLLWVVIQLLIFGNCLFRNSQQCSTPGIIIVPILYSFLALIAIMGIFVFRKLVHRFNSVIWVLIGLLFLVNGYTIYIIVERGRPF